MENMPSPSVLTISGILSVDYGKLTALLIEVNQEQQRRIEKLEAENKALTTENKSFNARLKKIEAALLHSN